MSPFWWATVHDRNFLVDPPFLGSPLKGGGEWTSGGGEWTSIRGPLAAPLKGGTKKRGVNQNFQKNIVHVAHHNAGNFSENHESESILGGVNFKNSNLLSRSIRRRVDLYKKKSCM